MKFNRANKRKQLEKAIALIQAVMNDDGLSKTRVMNLGEKQYVRALLADSVMSVANAVKALS